MKAMLLLADKASQSLKCLYDWESNRERFLYSLSRLKLHWMLTALTDLSSFSSAVTPEVYSRLLWMKAKMV